MNRAFSIAGMVGRWLPKKRISSVALLLLLIPSPAYAYLDAGTGSMILQLLLAGVAGIGVLLKVFWHNIAVFFGRRTEAVESGGAQELQQENRQDDQ